MIKVCTLLYQVRDAVPHAKKHLHQSRHAIIKRFELGENAGWRSVDEPVMEAAPKPQ